MKHRAGAVLAAITWAAGAAGALGALAWMAPAPASASGFLTARFAGEHGHPTTDNPSAIFYNPAALTNGKGLRLFVDGALAIRHADYERTQSDTPEPADAIGANVGKGSMNNVLGGAMPSLAYTHGDFSFGLGVFAPFAGSARWGSNPKFADDPNYPGPVDGVARWHSIEGTLTTLYGSAALAYKVGDTGLSLGVVGSLVYLDMGIAQALTASFDDNIGAEGRMHATFSGYSGSFGLGAQYEALPGELWLGASYQSPVGLYDRVRIDGTLRTNFGGSVDEQAIQLMQSFPDILMFGGRYRPRRDVELRLFGEFVRWSVFKSQCMVKDGRACELDDRSFTAPNEGAFANLVRRWHNSGGVRAGASYWATEDIELYLGAGWDGSAVPLATLEPGLMDGHDLTGAGGLRLEVGPMVRLSATYTHIHMLPRNNVGKSKLADEPAPNRLPSSHGRYAQWLGIASLNLELRFGQGT